MRQHASLVYDFSKANITFSVLRKVSYGNNENNHEKYFENSVSADTFCLLKR